MQYITTFGEEEDVGDEERRRTSLSSLLARRPPPPAPSSAASKLAVSVVSTLFKAAPSLSAVVVPAPVITPQSVADTANGGVMDTFRTRRSGATTGDAIKYVILTSAFVFACPLSFPYENILNALLVIFFHIVIGKLRILYQLSSFSIKG